MLGGWHGMEGEGFAISEATDVKGSVLGQNAKRLSGSKFSPLRTNDRTINDTRLHFASRLLLNVAQDRCENRSAAKRTIMRAASHRALVDMLGTCLLPHSRATRWGGEASH